MAHWFPGIRGIVIAPKSLELGPEYLASLLVHEHAHYSSGAWEFGANEAQMYFMYDYLKSGGRVEKSNSNKYFQSAVIYN